MFRSPAQARVGQAVHDLARSRSETPQPLRKSIGRHPRAFFNNQRSFFDSQFSIHLKEALAQRTVAIAAK
jgi:hypothetical protein